MDKYQNLSSYDPEKVSHVALSTYTHIVEKWQLDDVSKASLIGLTQGESVKELMDNAQSLPTGVLERISYVIKVHRCLSQLFASDERACTWLRATNRSFEDKAAIDVILSGINGLKRVVIYLERQCY